MRSTTTTTAASESVPHTAMCPRSVIGVGNWRTHRRTRQPQKQRFEAKRRDPQSDEARAFQNPKASFFLQLSGRRYYSPSLGRWLNRDPVEERGGMNVYVFVSNIPVLQVDRLGRQGFLFGEGAMTFQAGNDAIRSVGEGLVPESPTISNYSGFLRWFLNLGGGELSWEEFDSDGNTKWDLRREWRFANGDDYLEQLKSVDCGSSDLTSRYGGTKFFEYDNSSCAWISRYKAKVNKVISVKLEKNCTDCTYSLDITLEYYAHDWSNFDRGQTFGLGPFTLKDDWFVWIPDNTVFGTDYEIWAYTQDSFTLDGSYEEK